MSLKRDSQEEKPMARVKNGACKGDDDYDDEITQREKLVTRLKIQADSRDTMAARLYQCGNVRGALKKLQSALENRTMILNLCKLLKESYVQKGFSKEYGQLKLELVQNCMTETLSKIESSRSKIELCQKRGLPQSCFPVGRDAPSLDMQVSYLRNMSMQGEEQKAHAVRNCLHSSLLRTASSHTRIGSILYKMGDLKGALHNYETAVIIHQQLEPNSLTATLLNNVIESITKKQTVEQFIMGSPVEPIADQQSTGPLDNEYDAVLTVPDWSADSTSESTETSPEQLMESNALAVAQFNSMMGSILELQCHESNGEYPEEETVDQPSSEQLDNKYEVDLTVPDRSAELAWGSTNTLPEQLMEQYESALRVPDWSEDRLSRMRESLVEESNHNAADASILCHQQMQVPTNISLSECALPPLLQESNYTTTNSSLLFETQTQTPMNILLNESALPALVQESNDTTTDASTLYQTTQTQAPTNISFRGFTLPAYESKPSLQKRQTADNVVLPLKKPCRDMELCSEKSVSPLDLLALKGNYLHAFYSHLHD